MVASWSIWRRPHWLCMLQVLFAVVLLGCGNPEGLLGDAAAAQPVATAVSPCAESPRLSSDLRQLLEAPDPAAFAAERGLAYQDDGVRVVVELAAGETEGDLALVYGLTVEARYRNLLQVWAPLASLCDLANDSRVRVVRSPTPATGG